MLKLSTKGRYATRIMIYLAVQELSGQSPVRKQQIASSESISADYTEQILTRLKATGLVVSHRGVKGGFSLGRDASGITVADVLYATEGKSSFAPCLNGQCGRDIECAARAVWHEATALLESHFAGISIASLAKKAIALATMQVPTYEI